MRRPRAGVVFLVFAAVVLAATVILAAAGSVPLARAAERSPGAAMLWVRRFDGPAHASDSAYSLAVSPDGSRVFVTGASQGGPTGLDYATVAYDASTGTALWFRRFNGPGDGDDLPYAVKVAPDGSKVFVAGASWSLSSVFDYAVIAYDAATGSTLWLRRYNGPGNGQDYPFAMAVSPAGSEVFVTGESAGAGTDTDWATLSYDTSTGSSLWLRRYNGPGNDFDSATAVAVSPDGSRVFVTGASDGVGGIPDYATLAYDAGTGSTLWEQRYDGPDGYTDYPYWVAVSPDGSKVFVTGYDTAGVSYYHDYATLAYDAATGAQLWLQRYNGPGNGMDSAYFVASSPDGSKVFVTGFTRGVAGYDDYTTIAYDSESGAQLWLRAYNGPANGEDVAESLAVSPDGTFVYVAGYSAGPTSGLDYAAVAYDAVTGDRLGVRRYNGPGNGDDDAYSIAVTPDGSKLFVTGESTGARSGFDFATVAYSA